ncbi:MAG TPA: hypothetical protein VH309_08405 [Elusimicrobiota bacterium]|jgi:hypothetical protein|nr:hypothetical protein [Elusimicrobiota bacterium]
MSGAGRGAAAFLLLALTAGCAGVGARAGADGRREITVEAEGWAPLLGGDELSGRRRALAEAQKKAVEKAVGVTLRASTRVDDAVSVRQSIEANMGGTIRRYQVLSEGEQGGFFKVRIRAVVLYAPVDAGPPKRSPPRVAVNIPSERVSGAVRSALAAGDDDVVGDEAGEGGGEGADVVVTGVVETRGLADPRLGGFFSYTAKVSLTAANVRTGKVSRVDEEASAVDTDEREARDRALDKAGFDSGTALAASLAADGAAPSGAGSAPQVSDARTEAAAELPP